MTSHPAIGLIGLGLMGSALADRFLAAVQPVVGWDIDAGRRAVLRERGGDLKEGALIVVRGQQLLRDGQKVRIKDISK